MEAGETPDEPNKKKPATGARSEASTRAPTEASSKASSKASEPPKAKALAKVEAAKKTDVAMPPV